MEGEIKIRIVRVGRPHPQGMQFVAEIASPFDESWLPMEGDELVIREANSPTTPE